MLIIAMNNNHIKNSYCNMNKLLKKPHEKKSPLSGSSEMNPPANLLAAVYPHGHKNNPQTKILKK